MRQQHTKGTKDQPGALGKTLLLIDEGSSAFLVNIT
jgi:hypothetical protein